MSLRNEISLPTRPVLSHSADAVQANELLFVAGILPVDASGALVGEDDVSKQAQYVFAELDQILAAGGCDGTDVARINVYLTSIEDSSELDEPLLRTCGSARAAGTVVEVRALAVSGARIEIDATAVRSP
ncbi:Rid family hydrolase [Gaiella sp.]|uniref:RidA family protein n=1 Tax=Gaiella sp. TaxID=2663207 RepID=UPI0032676425